MGDMTTKSHKLRSAKSDSGDEAAKKLSGTVTRLVEETDGRKRVFFRPDPEHVRHIEGEARLASGEVAMEVVSLDGYEIGEVAEFEVG